LKRRTPAHEPDRSTRSVQDINGHEHLETVFITIMTIISYMCERTMHCEKRRLGRGSDLQRGSDIEGDRVVRLAGCALNIHCGEGEARCESRGRVGSSNYVVACYWGLQLWAIGQQLAHSPSPQS